MVTPPPLILYNSMSDEPEVDPNADPKEPEEKDDPEYEVAEHIALKNK